VLIPNRYVCRCVKLCSSMFKSNVAQLLKAVFGDVYKYGYVCLRICLRICCTMEEVAVAARRSAEHQQKSKHNRCKNDDSNPTWSKSLSSQGKLTWYKSQFFYMAQTYVKTWSTYTKTHCRTMVNNHQNTLSNIT
jgi:hypothetical protein